MGIITALILVVLLFQLGISTFLLLQSLKIYKNFKGFMIPEGENQQSPLGAIVEGVAEVIGNKVKGAILGVLSGASRVEKAAGEEIVSEGMANSNPLLGILAGFPKIRRLIAKNPELVTMAMSKLGGLKGNNPGIPGGNGSKWTGKFGGE